MNFKKIYTEHLSLKFLLSIFVVFIYLFSISVSVGAQSQEQWDLIDSGILYYDIDPPEIVTGCIVSAPSNSTIYMIGDSITDGSLTQLENAFSAASYRPTIDGVSSRSLSRGSEATNGLSVLENSATDFADAGSIIVALGTNGGLTENNISETLDIIERENSEANIYWVNIGVDNSLRDGSNLPAEEWNQNLATLAGGNRYSVINWAEVVANNSGIIQSDGLGVHPNEAGRELFASSITEALAGGSTSGSCGSTTLVGDTNEEKVWNFMIEKGLQPFQAAGFMGNMQAEAGFEPRRVEYPVRSSGDVWIDGRFPDSLSDTVPGCLGASCRPGYGIVQWTAEGRKQGLREIALELGLPEGDLGLQLEYVWREIAGTTFRGTASVRQQYFQTYGQNTPIIDALLSTETLEEATSLILNHYEIPANIPAALVKRTGFARSWLLQFGSGGI